MASAASSATVLPRSADLDPSVNDLIEVTRARARRRLAPGALVAAVASGLTFAGVSAALVATVPSQRSPSAAMVALLVLAYAVATRVRFQVGSGVALPTQLVLVPMLFRIPLGYVPLLVAGGMLLGRSIDIVRGRVQLDRVVLIPRNSLHAFGPVAVLALAGEAAPRLDRWPLYVAALAAQFTVDFVVSSVYEFVASSVSPRKALPFFGWTFVVDACLAPIGLLVALAPPGSVLLVVPLIALLARFARERQVRIDHALELSHAYRGTALLLGDVVEADDAYTGSHSRDVVSLVLGVCDRLGVSGAERRDAEFAALLHDVGKIKIPAEIINKPGPLGEDERAVVSTHTLEGERLLSQVGGILGDVGRIVRSCHENWDGSGYPDGLAGAEIPLAARIVRCCDAFSAMTTDRPYRRARPVEAAIAELHRCAGSDFDPAVVEALATTLHQASHLLDTSLDDHAKGRQLEQAKPL